jgi:preprotein translocase subunit YajC
MDLLIADVWAQNAAPPGAGFIELLPLLIVFMLLYLIMVRPQAKRQKEHKKMVEALGKGDEVVTNGGLLGRINEIGENFIVLEVADGIEVKVQRQSISATMPKGTYSKTL